MKSILLVMAIFMLGSMGYAQHLSPSNLEETISYSGQKAPKTFMKNPDFENHAFVMPAHGLNRGSQAYGYFHYPENAYATFDVDNVSAYTVVTSALPALYGGSYYDGFLYAYETTSNNVVFHKIAATTGAIVSSVARPELYGKIVNALAFDYSAVRMYAIMDNAIHAVNLTTGALTFVANVGIPLLVLNMAIDLYGTMYVVQAGSANLYTVNKTTGSVTLIGSTGRSGVNYAQSMAFDYSDGTLYWNECTIYSTSNFLKIDTETGLATLLQANTLEVTSFFIPYTAYQQEAPSAISNFTGTQGPSGALNAELSWTNPSTTVAGNPLTELTAVKIYQDDVLIHTVTNPPIGGVSSYTVNVTADALYTYIIVPENPAGDGVKTRYYLYIGVDLPGAATNVVFTRNENNGMITWVAPATGLHGGWFDVSTLTYTITRLPDNVVLATGLTTTIFIDNTITDINLYSYKITSINSAGTGGEAISNELIIGEAIIPPYATSYEDGEVWQIWTFINENEVSGRWYRESRMEVAQYARTGIAIMTYQWGPTQGNSWMFSPPFQFEAGKSYEISFWTRSLNNYLEEKLALFVATDQTPESVIGEAIWENHNIFGETYIQTKLILADYPEGDYTIGFYCFSDPNKGILFVDDFAIREIADQDAAAEKLYGPLQPMVGKQFKFKARIKNEGLENMSGYTVKLIDESNNVLATNSTGTEIAVEESLLVDILWTPTSAGNYSLRAVVELPDDLISGNDITPAIVAIVQPETAIFTGTVGDGEMIQADLPFGLQKYSSATQTIYFDHELIGQAAVIEEVQCVTNFIAPIMPGLPFKIWMANTELTQLSDWLPQSELQLVYDGSIAFQFGVNTVPIPLDNPFLYDGKNLVVVIVRTDYFAMPPNNCYATQTQDFQARTLYWNSMPPTEFNWTQEGILSDLHPNTLVKMSFDGGSASGIITDLDATPLEGAQVQIEGTNIRRFTNASGAYSFDLLLPGEYTFVASKLGYFDEPSDEETVVLNANTVVNMQLTPIPTYAISGKVTETDIQNSIADVVITLTGYNSYATTSVADGEYVIEGVYDGFIYTLTAKKGGYETYIDEVEVNGGNVVFDFTMLEIIIPPAKITATPVDNHVHVEWIPPIAGIGTSYILDDGSAEAGFRINADTDASFGNIYTNDDSGVITSVDIFGYYDDSGMGGDTRWVTMDIYDENRELIGSSEPFILPENEWINVELPYLPYEGTFYAMVHWSVDPTQTQYLGYDMNGTNSQKAFSYIIDAAGWRNFSYISNYYGVFLVRVNALTQGKSMSYSYNENRLLVSYILYRLLKDQPEAEWTEIAETAALEYNDEEWNSLPEGEYQYALKARYSGDNYSTAILSNVVTKIEYTITASVVGDHGTITPSGDVTVVHGGTQTFTFNPDTNYEINEVKVDGTTVTNPGTSYTFTNITANHTITVSFKIKTYTVTVSSNNTAWGTVEGGGTFDYGASVTITATPNTGYKFNNWTTEGVVVSETENFTFNVTQDVAFVANFGSLGISSVGMPVEFTVYPNPANDVIKVVRSAATKAQIEIYNSNGALVKELEITEAETEINVSSLALGVYIIKLIDNQNTATQRFVKE
jgi:hypothetical protein